jgi:putative ABC transport system ATP-binding protein
MDFCNMYEPADREQRAMALLDMVGLADVAHHMPAAVSGGQQQSAAVARALANDPPIIVADEPTGNLDSRAASFVFELFEDLTDQGKTILMVTHDNALAERASRTLLLSDGEIVNETVAVALPYLTHQQMLRATKQLEPRRFEPGEPIITEGTENDRFYLVSRGEVDVTLDHNGDGERTIARIGPGQFFGEISLLDLGSKSIATVKAALHAPVEVLALSRAFVRELLDESHTMREAIAQVAQARAEETASLRAGLRRAGSRRGLLGMARRSGSSAD